MHALRVVAFAGVIASAICARSAAADDRSVSDYLKDGWDIKAVTQISPVGYTQIILQKDTTGVICTIYYSAKDGWTKVGLGGCTPLP